MIRDIINEFISNGHSVYVVCPYDVNDNPSESFIEIEGVRYLFVKSGYPVGKVGIVKKVKNFLTVDHVFKTALSKACHSLEFDLALYMTPPITLVNTIEWAKKRFDAVTYLMLKDIFPQNAVDLGMMRKNGVTGVGYRYFRNKEKKLYGVSDYIGCMSPANIKYVVEHNPEVNKNKVGLCVNCYKLAPLISVDKKAVRSQYGIPQDAVAFLYGGNLGKPQGLDFFVKVLKENQNKSDRFFLICGGGNDQMIIRQYIDNERPSNVKFIDAVSPEEYDKISMACDVGLIFLKHSFTIPNFPSRLLSIMLNAKPALAATDKVSDIGDVIKENRFGFACESKDTSAFNFYVDEFCNDRNLIDEMGARARECFEKSYTQINVYNQIMEGYHSVKNK